MACRRCLDVGNVALRDLDHCARAAPRDGEWQHRAVELVDELVEGVAQRTAECHDRLAVVSGNEYSAVVAQRFADHEVLEDVEVLCLVHDDLRVLVDRKAEEQRQREHVGELDATAKGELVEVDHGGAGGLVDLGSHVDVEAVCEERPDSIRYREWRSARAGARFRRALPARRAP